ncbi:rhodanese-like domain-containing protein [Granulosicoccaceae sp. 1_MG-2023]|nr:rhodanese-like domain-containing protein [Granulosicoccaceae sp. 1_MG-2023]
MPVQARRAVIAVLLMLFPVLLLAEGQVRTISDEELAGLLEQGVVLVDVRTEPEWRETGIVKGAHLLTFVDSRGRLQADFVPRLQAVLGGRDVPVALICRSGNRSAMAASVLASQAGFSEIYNVRGGMRGWLGASRPVQAYPPAP